MKENSMRVTVCHPEIPQNVGALLRLSACWNISMDFVGPFTFPWSDAGLRRAGLDYIPKALYRVFHSFEDYCSNEPLGRRIFLDPEAGNSYHEFTFHDSDILFVGSESSGFSQDFLSMPHKSVSIPMVSSCRSLNMSVSVAVVLSEALRQLNFFNASP